MSITLKPLPDHAAIGEAVADRLLALVRKKPDAVIGLATGSSPLPAYEALVAACDRARREGNPVDFSRVTFFALDEYVGLAPDHPNSYHQYLWDRLLGPIGATPANVHIPNGSAKDADAACAEYETALATHGPVDLWIAGLGRNGHLAFNEPGTPFASRTHCVALSEQTRTANRPNFDRADDVPTHAITVGLGTLRDHAKEVLLVVSGENKAGILAQLLCGGVHTKVPASMLKTMNTTLYADDAALAQYRAPQR